MQRVVTKHIIDHKPKAEDFTVIEVDTPLCPANGVLARVVFLSVDPYIGSVLRGRHFGFKIPEPMTEAPPASVVAQVVHSRTDQAAEGDWIVTDGCWQEILAADQSKIRKVDPSIAPLSSYIGVLGMPGVTAWASAKHLAKVSDGDTVLVNAAAGPVGGTFGQLAKIYGAKRVVGVAGGKTKCDTVTGIYNFDACIDYEKEGWREQLTLALPDGLNVFHENVSSDMAMLALSHAQPYTRGVICGLADSYHHDQQHTHPLNAGIIIAKRAQISGVVVYDFMDRYTDFVTEVTALIKQDKIRYAEDIIEGLENAPTLFEKMVNGNNIGKSLVKVAGT